MAREMYVQVRKIPKKIRTYFPIFGENPEPVRAGHCGHKKKVKSTSIYYLLQGGKSHLNNCRSLGLPFTWDDPIHGLKQQDWRHRPGHHVHEGDVSMMFGYI